MNPSVIWKWIEMHEKEKQKQKQYPNPTSVSRDYPVKHLLLRNY